MKFNWQKKNNLDEMQEQTLLHIEGSCFWILYVMLLVAVIGQTLFMEAGPREVLPELICFMAASIVMVVRCAKNGIWDRHFKPNEFDVQYSGMCDRCYVSAYFLSG